MKKKGKQLTVFVMASNFEELSQQITVINMRVISKIVNNSTFDRQFDSSFNFQVNLTTSVLRKT